MADFKKLDGVGPSRYEQLDERFGSFEALANADYEELAEEIDRLSEDKALDIIVQAQNEVGRMEEEAKDNEDDELSPEEVSELAEEADTTDVSDGLRGDYGNVEEDDESTETVDLELELSPLQYDLTVAALVGDIATVYNSNPRRYEAGMALLEALREKSGGSVTVEGVNRMQMNTLHAAVRQLKNRYRGENIIEFMDELAEVESAVDRQRR
jgi:hypothetical protein